MLGGACMLLFVVFDHIGRGLVCTLQLCNCPRPRSHRTGWKSYSVVMNGIHAFLLSYCWAPCVCWGAPLTPQAAHIFNPRSIHPMWSDVGLGVDVPLLLLVPYLRLSASSKRQCRDGHVLQPAKLSLWKSAYLTVSISIETNGITWIHYLIYYVLLTAIY